MPSLPITIITPSYQQATYLDECLRSVREQQGAEVEHIVVDGGSTDGSVAIIAAHADRLAWWCSEPDGGQSAAINKGLARATGTVFNWLNSDDALLPGALQQVAGAFASDPALLAYGGVRRILQADGAEAAAPLDDPTLPGRLFIAPYINQQSTFYRLDAVRAIGGVEEKLHYAMDYELWLQLLFRHGTAHLRFDPVPLAVFRMHQDAKSTRARWGFADEIAGVLHGLCMSTDNDALARVLKAGHDMPTGLRTIPVRADDRKLVHRMTVHFLLKWHHAIFNERQFRMMRSFLDTVPLDMGMLDAEETAWHTELREQLAVPGWWAFRLRRKWRHLSA